MKPYRSLSEKLKLVAAKVIRESLLFMLLEKKRVFISSPKNWSNVVEP